MQTAGGKADGDIAIGYPLAVYYLIFFHGADDKTDQVVVPSGVYTGHLGRLAADKGTADPLTGFSQPLDNRLYLIRQKPAHGDVIEEEEGLGAAGEDVVDAVIDQVGADGVIPVQGIGYFKLGANPVGAGNQHRLLESLQLEKPAEQPGPGQDLGAQGAPGMLCNKLLEPVGGIDADAGGIICVFNLPTSCKKWADYPHHLPNHLPLPAAAASGATAIQRLMVISIAIA